MIYIIIIIITNNHKQQYNRHQQNHHYVHATIIIIIITTIIIRYPDLFDVVIAADVIYEDTQIIPLIKTVVAILKGSQLYIYDDDDHENGSDDNNNDDDHEDGSDDNNNDDGDYNYYNGTIYTVC